MPKLLSDPEIELRLLGLKGWKHEGDFISKVFEFKTFAKGMEFVDSVAKVAEKEEHHPDIHIRYTTITLMVQTHSEGGVTEWDIDLAEAIEKMLKGGAKRASRR